MSSERIEKLESVLKRIESLNKTVINSTLIIDKKIENIEIDLDLVDIYAKIQRRLRS